jgi:hypothetical protein
MNKKELRNLAKKIAKLEQQSANAVNEKERNKIELEIMSLCGKVTSFDDITAIDEIVSEILEKNS